MSSPLDGPYAWLGVRPIINCAGVRTPYGNSTLLPEIAVAVQEAADRFVVMDELAEAIGARLAALTGAGWGIVTAGSAAALCQAAAACVSFSAARWAIRQSDGKYADAGKYWYPQLFAAAMRQGDLDWLTYVNSAFDVAIHAQDSVFYDAALKKYAGFDTPPRTPGMPMF